MASVDLEVKLTGPDANKVSPKLVEMIRVAAQIMVRKNTDRGDCWKSVGMLGTFIELHTCYNRIREMLWNREPRINDYSWVEEVENALQDMRNFTILMQLALEAKNIRGDDSEKYL